jgi:hypothetical protein
MGLEGFQVFEWNKGIGAFGCSFTIFRVVQCWVLFSAIVQVNVLVFGLFDAEKLTFVYSLYLSDELWIY